MTNSPTLSDELPSLSLTTSTHFPSCLYNGDTLLIINSKGGLHDSASSQLPQNNKFEQSREISEVQLSSSSSGALVTDSMESREDVAADVTAAEYLVMEEHEKDDAGADSTLPHNPSVTKDNAED